MSKEKLITRTITTTTAAFMCIDTETTKVDVIKVHLIGKLSNEGALKRYKELVETDTFKVVSCQSTEYEQHLFGMSEREFIEHAKVLPSRKKTENEE